MIKAIWKISEISTSFFIVMKCKDILSFNTVGLSVGSYFHIFLALLWAFNVSAQLDINFDSGQFTDTKWVGDISHFKINALGQLQLNAQQPGESALFTKFKVPKDSIVINLYFKLQFAPSNDNNAKIYLFTDNIDQSSANSYYIKIGESGSNDAIQFWKTENGTSTLLGSGKMGGVASDPADARLKIVLTPDGFWLVSTDYLGNNVFEDDIEFFDVPILLQDSMYFGISCKYTATRVDKFYFDDILIKKWERDTIAPKIKEVKVINPTALQVIFSEPLDSVSAKNRSNFSLVYNGAMQQAEMPGKVTLNTALPDQLVLTFNKELLSGIDYTLLVYDVKDKSGNKSNTSVDFIYAVTPESGDLILTEVLTDPYLGGDDFIEIYNASSKYLKLDGLIVKNRDKNESKSITTNFILLPSEYVALSRNIDFLIQTYKPVSTANFVAAVLPSLNVSSANITLISLKDNVEMVLDSFDYDQSFHFDLIDETKGISLERISLKSPANDPGNWHSASAQVLYATPGFRNSNFTNTGSVVGKNGLFPDKKTFSPDNDNLDDFLLLNYILEKPGYLATVKIFDAEGFPVTDLVNNQLLGTEGIIKWDGFDAEGKQIKTGLYIIFARLFHPDGEVKVFKHVVVSASKF